MNSPLVSLGKPPGERADAARNREHLLQVAREMIAEHGVEKVTMDGLAERACLGKGTVFRRFGTRAGIFRALLDADDRAFQHDVMQGPPPLGPGAGPVPRLAAYGRARIAFLVDQVAIARAALDRNQPVPGGGADFTRIHIRMLLTQARLDITDPDNLSVQLTAALEGPILLGMWMREPGDTTLPARPVADSGQTPLADSWQALVERLCRVT
ncbi:MAG: TetR/AcrR family transcriptional regulator [Streptosporangiaceae bacterium]